MNYTLLRRTYNLPEYDKARGSIDEKESGTISLVTFEGGFIKIDNPRLSFDRAQIESAKDNCIRRRVRGFPLFRDFILSFSDNRQPADLLLKLNRM